jgi:hypothetical protein
VPQEIRDKKAECAIARKLVYEITLDPGGKALLTSRHLSQARLEVKKMPDTTLSDQEVLLKMADGNYTSAIMNNLISTGFGEDELLLCASGNNVRAVCNTYLCTLSAGCTLHSCLPRP